MPEIKANQNVMYLSLKAPRVSMFTLSHVGFKSKSSIVLHSKHLTEMCRRVFFFATIVARGNLVWDVFLRRLVIGGVKARALHWRLWVCAVFMNLTQRTWRRWARVSQSTSAGLWRSHASARRNKRLCIVRWNRGESAGTSRRSRRSQINPLCRIWGWVGTVLIIGEWG